MERTVAPMSSFDPDSSLKIIPIRNQTLTARWGFLIAGVLYGSARYSRLNKQEQIKLAELERTKEEREAKARLERERKFQKEIDDLNSQLGIKE